MSTVRIRSARPSDAAAIDAAGWAGALHHHLGNPGLLAHPDRQSTEWSAAALAESPESTCLVAESDQQVVGYVHAAVISEARPMFVPHRYGRIEAVAVLPALRSRGIGTSLLRVAEQWVSQQGCKVVRLSVFASNGAACSLHLRRGYTPVVTFMQRDLDGQRMAWSKTSPSMDAHIRDATAEDVGPISRLVQAGFKAHIAPDWEVPAQTEFLAETVPEKLATRIADAALCLVHEADAQIDGVILLPRPTLVQLFFVVPSQLRQGIGRKLWETARSRVEARYAEVKTVELNSSPYAVAAYRRLGFFPISEPFVRNGAVATRMACWLPARTLEKRIQA